MRVAVTGCAGFIGSNLIDELLRRGCEVIGLDNFSSGSMANMAEARKDEDFTLIEGDILSEEDLERAMTDVDTVYHLAANPDVRAGVDDTKVHFNQNILGTYNVLEMMRKKKVKALSFTSTSTVYGEAAVVPTPEDYGPMMPISLYGSSKLACEALISSYCAVFDMSSFIFRFANVVGKRSGHGVIHDFIKKLEMDPTRLEILGVPPGTMKSYCHIADCIDAMMSVEKNRTEKVGVFNIGSDDTLDVESLAEIVCQEMGLSNVKYHWTGGVDGGRGWRGDVKRMQLSIEKIKSSGWKPTMTSGQSVMVATKELLSEKKPTS